MKKYRYLVSFVVYDSSLKSVKFIERCFLQLDTKIDSKISFYCLEEEISNSLAKQGYTAEILSFSLIEEIEETTKAEEGKETTKNKKVEEFLKWLDSGVAVEDTKKAIESTLTDFMEGRIE